MDSFIVGIFGNDGQFYRRSARRREDAVASRSAVLGLLIEGTPCTCVRVILDIPL